MGSVRLEKVSKSFEDKKNVVRDVSISIRDKEFVVLVGPSGCGKSTTLRIVAGLEEATSGNIYIDDNLVNDIPPKDRDIAMVFQNYALYPHMTVFDNLAFGLKMRRQPKQEIEQQVKKTADILGIRDLLERKPKVLSGGQRQRVALGRAIVRSPKVFLFDEPLSNLDANLRVQMRAEILRLHKKLETTTIYVTHDQVEAMSMGERIVVMRNGTIQQVDTPLAIYNTPMNRFVASFIGSPTMNFLDGKISDTNGLAFEHASGTTTLSLPTTYNRLCRQAGREVTLGIRPEHILTHASGPSPQRITADVDLIEPIGSEIYVHFAIGSVTRVVSRVPADVRLSVGRSTEVFIDTSRLHFFDKLTGESL